MKSPLTPKLFDSFVGRINEVLPDKAVGGAGCCESLGRAWQQLGLRRGDVVLLCLPNGKELLNQFFGVLMAQGVPALVTPLTPAGRLREISHALGAWAIAGFRLPSSEIAARSHERIGQLNVAILQPTSEPAAAPGEVIVMTSGTSGVSSGCVFDFEALLLNGERHAESIGQRAEDMVLVNLPLYFSFGLVAQALASFVVGNGLVISGPPFHVGMYRETLEAYDVTISSLTPVLIRSLLASNATFPDEMRTLSVGGDALAPDMVGRLLELRPGGELYLTYGLTQAGPRVSTLAAHTEPPRLHKSVGRPIGGTTVFLRPTPDGGGLTQLYVASETVMKRSIGHVEGRPNHSLMAPQTVATGDLFDQDEDGYLFFKGRLCDYINRKGEKISLSTVRRLASQLPHVIAAKTLVTGCEEGHEDFDLVLCLDASGEALPDQRLALRRLLRQSEMPRNIRIEMPSGTGGHAYK